MKTTLLLLAVGITLFCGSVACNIATESVQGATLQKQGVIESVLAE